MARVLEALNGTGPRGRPADAAASNPPPSSQHRAETPAEKAAEDIPFIEVGGAQIEASAAVLAARRLTSPRPVAPLPPQPVPQAIEHQPQGIEFRPVLLGSPFTSITERFVPGLIALHQPEHPVSEQYRSLLTSVAGVGTASGPRILLFSGATTEADTTTVALNLGITHARQGGSRIIVVDAAGYSACVAEKLGLPPAPGLHEVLSGAVSVRRAVQETGLPGFQVLTAGEVGGRPCLAARSLRATLAHFTKRFRLVLVVGPSWSGGPEMVTLASACEGVYLVAPHDRAESPAVTELLRVIPSQGVSLRGCILAQG